MPRRTAARATTTRPPPFELGVVCEVFGIDRSASGLPMLDFAVVSVDAAPVTTSLGFVLSPKYRLERAAKADLVGVPASAAELGASGAVRDLLRETVDRGVWVLSLCSGAFTLAAAGLLGDRRVR